MRGRGRERTYSVLLLLCTTKTDRQQRQTKRRGGEGAPVPAGPPQILVEWGVVFVSRPPPSSILSFFVFVFFAVPLTTFTSQHSTAVVLSPWDLKQGTATMVRVCFFLQRRCVLSKSSFSTLRIIPTAESLSVGGRRICIHRIWLSAAY